MFREQPHKGQVVFNALPGEVPALAKKAGVARRTVQKWLDIYMYGPKRKARITKWRRQRRGPPVATYGKGSGSDAPKPEPFTDAERCARWLANLRKQDGAHELQLKRRAAREAAKQARYTKDPLMAWIPAKAERRAA